MPNLIPFRRNVYEGISLLDDGLPFDRLVLDLPEPWQVVPHAAQVLRSGGMYLSFVPTVPQVVQTVEALQRGPGLVETHDQAGDLAEIFARPLHRRALASAAGITSTRPQESGPLVSP